jgi:UDP-arabinose 4-epimerase
MTRSILVTGGAGYIGSHTCKALAQAGYQPVVYDNLSTGNAWAVKWGPLIQGDIADRELVQATLEKHQVSAVIHFAASAYVGESMHNPYKYLQGNAAGSLELLEAMKEAKVRNIVVSSTCATYGMPQQVPISETELQNPVNPYGESKLYIEKALKWYGVAHGLGWMALRYFNAAGSDAAGEIGECHGPETHLIPLVIQAALETGPPVTVMGTDYATPDGTAIRDYIHVEDLASAHIRALEYLESGGESTALNLGMGRGYSVREVIAAVGRISGRPVPAQEAGRRAGDPPVLVADTSRARQVLSWQPRYTNIDTVVGTAWGWFSKGHGSAAARIIPWR